MELECVLEIAKILSHHGEITMIRNSKIVIIQVM
jgi:hypothetical protein